MALVMIVLGTLILAVNQWFMASGSLSQTVTGKARTSHWSSSKA